MLKTEAAHNGDNGNDDDKKTCPPGMKLVDGDCVPAGNDDNGYDKT